MKILVINPLTSNNPNPTAIASPWLINSPLQRLIPLHNKMNPIPAVKANMKCLIIEACCSNSFCLLLLFFDRNLTRFFWVLVSLEKSIIMVLVESIKMFLKRGEGFEPPNVRTATWRLTGLGHPRVVLGLIFTLKPFLRWFFGLNLYTSNVIFGNGKKDQHNELLVCYLWATSSSTWLDDVQRWIFTWTSLW